VDVQLAHPDTAVLARASAELAETLRTYTDQRSVENTYAAGKPQLDFTLRPEARTLGLTAVDVGRQLRAHFFGAEALREQRGRNELRVMVRLPEDERASEYDVEEVLIRTPTGGFAPLGTVAELRRNRAPTSIEREDGQRTVDVKADLAAGVRSSQDVIASLKADVLPALRARHPDLKAELVGEQREQNESLSSLGSNYLVALFVVYALLAVPFRSYTQPLIIMFAIPFGIVGAVAGHLLLGFELSIISMMGIVALSGVAVNDSLVLIEAINQYRREGDGPMEAAVRAGMRRMRPILLTSLTTFFGLMPMIFEKSPQARFLIPMAISLGFGVLFTTVIALLLVPSLYLTLEENLAWGRRAWAWLRPRLSPGGGAAGDAGQPAR
jgi:multidrug efflux pump subunit AcrB